MIDSLPALIAILGVFLAYLQSQTLDNNARVANALKAIQEAITETSKYLERENLKERQRTKELELSGLWNKAAISIRKINPSLARKLRFKSEYWENSAKLSRREIHQGGIALRQVQKEFENLYTSK